MTQRCTGRVAHSIKDRKTNFPDMTWFSRFDATFQPLNNYEHIDAETRPFCTFIRSRIYLGYLFSHGGIEFAKSSNASKVARQE